jgi:phosphoribosylanthranilate isomerase
VSHSVVRVKICGVTSVDDALECVTAGADWIGLNFHPASPRFLDLARAASIVTALPPSVSPVGVFVDRPAAEIAALARSLGLQIVQLHGEEPPEDLLALGHLQLIKAFRLSRAAGWSTVIDYVERARNLGRVPDAILIDAYVPGQAGGTGASVEDELLDAIPPLPRLILAGGLTVENVAAKVARVRPWMVDVASGVESAPGRKDSARVAAFVRAAKSAGFPGAVGGRGSRALDNSH